MGSPGSASLLGTSSGVPVPVTKSSVSGGGAGMVTGTGISKVCSHSCSKVGSLPVDAVGADEVK